MNRFFSRLLDPIRGSGDHAITLPPMDGALQPNEILERAPLAAALPAPDAVVLSGSEIVVSAGRELIAFASRALERTRVVGTFDAEVSCLALSPKGVLAAGLASGKVAFSLAAGDGVFHNARRPPIESLGDQRMSCPTALAWARDGSLVVCNGSESNGALDWKRDLTQGGESGSVWRVEPDGKARLLARNLAFPNGALCQDDGSVIVSESWKSRLLRIGLKDEPKAMLADLPGYPAGLAPRAAGGAWLAVFAPRSQLFEFVLREREFREEMMREIDPDYWIAPSLKPPRSFLEPLQGGALKQLGLMKPWAPTRSYGLVIALDRDFQPEASVHSRADGSRHGIRNVLEYGGRLWVASKGGDAVVALDVNSFGDFP
jgi:hypothetical protein